MNFWDPKYALTTFGVVLTAVLLTSCGGSGYDDDTTYNPSSPAAEETGPPDGTSQFTDKFGRNCVLYRYSGVALDCDYPPASTP